MKNGLVVIDAGGGITANVLTILIFSLCLIVVIVFNLFLHAYLHAHKFCKNDQCTPSYSLMIPI